MGENKLLDRIKENRIAMKVSNEKEIKIILTKRELDCVYMGLKLWNCTDDILDEILELY